MNKYLQMAITFGEKLLIALLIVFIGFKIAKYIVKLLNKGRGYSKLSKNAKSFLNSFISIAIKTIILVVAAGIIGIPTTSIITLIGSAGLAIGLALQGGLSNIAGGLMILITKPFEVGNYIETANVKGTVTDITMFYTKLTTLDNKIITIPNGTLSSSTITNFDSQEARRVDLEFSVSYNSNIDKVKETMLEVAKANKLVLKDRPVTARMIKHDSSALVFALKVWCKTPDYWTVYFDMTEEIKRAFDKEKIEIPYPQVDVHMKNK